MNERNDAARQQALTLRFEGKTYAEIGEALGITRQRAQQIISPTGRTIDAVIARAHGRCEGDACGKPAGRTGHIHHRQARGMTAETYNAEPNLTLLCIPCHQHAHMGFVSPKTLLTPEQREAIYKLQGTRVGAQRLNISYEVYQAHREAGERWCSAHKTWEPAERFGKNRQTSDGIATRCREGNREMVRIYQGKEYQRDYYRRNRERLNAYQRAWNRKRRAQQEQAS